MDLESLRALLTVLDQGSLAAAAEHLRLPRSTLRRRIERLEALVGAELFHRDSRGARPTIAARSLAERARPLLAQLQALASPETVEDVDAQRHLHLLLPVGLPPELTVIGLSQARHSFPGLHLEASFGEVGPGQLPEGVDLAIHFGPAPPRGPYRTRTLARVPERLLASPAFLDSHGTPEDLDQLLALPLLCWRSPGSSGRHLPLRDGTTLAVTPRLISPDIHALRLAAAAGLGIALVPDARLPAGLGVDGLVPVLEALVGDDCALRLVLPEASSDSPRARQTLALVDRLLHLVGEGEGTG